MSPLRPRLEALEKFLAEDPDDSFTRYALALECASAGDAARAVALLQETVERDPRYVPAWQQLGSVLQRLGRTEEAAAALARGIAAARAAKDLHAASEMTQELESLQDNE